MQDDDDQKSFGFGSDTRTKAFLLITLISFFVYATIYVCQAVLNLDKDLVTLGLIFWAISFAFSVLNAIGNGNKLIKALPVIILFSMIGLRFLIYYIKYR